MYRAEEMCFIIIFILQVKNLEQREVICPKLHNSDNSEARFWARNSDSWVHAFTPINHTVSVWCFAGINPAQIAVSFIYIKLLKFLLGQSNGASKITIDSLLPLILSANVNDTAPHVFLVVSNFLLNITKIKAWQEGIALIFR